MAEQDRKRNQGGSEGGSTAGGVSGTAGGEADRGAMQTAAAGCIGYAITFAINLPPRTVDPHPQQAHDANCPPSTVDPHLQLAYDAHAAFLCVTFFAAIYAVFRSLFKEETEATKAMERRRWYWKMMVLISVSAAISFALRIFIAAVTCWRVLLITAVVSVLSWLFLRYDVVGMISWPKLTTSGNIFSRFRKLRSSNIVRSTSQDDLEVQEPVADEHLPSSSETPTNASTTEIENNNQNELFL